MLESMFYLLFGFALFWLLLSLYYGHPQHKNFFWHSVGMAFSAIMWYIIALLGLEIEIPYAVFNTTSNATETGFFTYTTEYSIFMTYIFSLIGTICMFYMIFIIFYTIYEKR